MPFTSTGTDIEMVQNPKTGRLDFQWDGTANPTYSDTQSHRVATLLVERRGKWAQDPTGQRGSVLYLIKHDLARTASDMESAARDALEKASREQFIKPNPTVIATRLGAGVYKVKVIYKTARGAEQVVEV